jgi:hypothetical protein
MNVCPRCSTLSDSETAGFWLFVRLECPKTREENKETERKGGREAEKIARFQRFHAELTVEPLRVIKAGN